MVKIAAIYKIESPSGNCYIGSTVNYKLRHSQHLSAMRNGKHHAHAVQSACDKYGCDNLKFTVLEYVLTIEKLIEIEQYWIDELQPKYNSCMSARGGHSNRGKVHTEETRRKMSEGSTNVFHTEETKRKIGLAHKGKVVSKETRDKLSKSHSGKSRMTSEQYKTAGEKRQKQVVCLDTGDLFLSVNHLAESLSLHPSTVSKHLNHKERHPTLSGKIYELW